jgi:hypothetical protein
VRYKKGSILEVVVHYVNEVRWDFGRNKFSNEPCGPARISGVTIESGVFCAVRAEAIQR